MSARARWPSCRPNIATSPASRSRAAPTAWIWSRGSSPPRRRTSSPRGCCFVKSATAKPPCSAASGRSSSTGQSPRCSSPGARRWLRLPVRAQPLERGPFLRQRSNQRALAARQPAPYLRPVVAKLLEEQVRDRNVVEFAERILELGEAREKRPHCLLRKTGREEVAAVAQALDRDAHRVAAGAISPIDLPHTLGEFAIRTLERASRVIE